jgi:tetratricopeptide (TPR) repeat protein
MAAEAKAKVAALIAEDKYSEADALASTELEKAQSKGDKAGMVAMLVGVAEVSMTMLQSDRALKAAREAWPLSKEIGDKALQAEVLVTMVSALILKGNVKEALRAAASSMTMVKEAGIPALEAALLHSTAAAHLKLGDADDAIEAEEKAMAIYKTAKDKKGEAASVTTIAKGYRILGKFDQAISTAKEACSIWRSLGSAAGIVTALDTICEAQAAQGFPKASLAAAEEELSLLRASGPSLKSELMMMEKVAQIASDLGEKIETIRTMEEMIKVCQKAGDKAGEAMRTLATAEKHAEMNHSQDGLRLAKEAEELFASLGDKASEEEAKKLQTTIFVKRGQHSKAPHRSEALLALKSFVRAVEQREIDQVRAFEADLDKAASAIKDTEMSAALESLFERDPEALQFLQKQGWDLDSFKAPTKIYQYPHKAFYLTMIAGGMNFGPQFRSVHPFRKDKPADKDCVAFSCSYLPLTESWQGMLAYRHGIIDAGLQSAGVFSFPPQ